MVDTQILHASACPDENVLGKFLAAELDHAGARRVEAHLDVCPACHHLAGAVAEGVAEAHITHVSPAPAAPSVDADAAAVSWIHGAMRGVPRPGDHVGRYLIEKQLGEGGMGVVYAARDPDLGRDVALKIVAPARAAQLDQRKRLLREARAAARLQHPNVVAVYDVGELDGMAYFAMELVDGAPLRGRIGDMSVPLPLRLRWLADIAAALAAAHDRGLVHRDVKPENVMVRIDDTVKVVDFGIARLADGGVATQGTWGVGRVTQPGAVVGTPLYMAPEQASGANVDPRADQFAWGLLAYELLSGVHPRTGASDAAPAPASASSPPVLSHVPLGVDAVIRRAMADDPGARFASMHDVVSALASASRGARRLRPFATPWPAAAAGFALASIGVAALFVLPEPRDDVRAAAVEVSAAHETAAGVPVAWTIQRSEAAAVARSPAVKADSLPAHRAPAVTPNSLFGRRK